MKVQLIWAQTTNRVIGNQGVMPWHLPNDFKFFKQQTSNTMVVMGKRTWQSIGKPLPNRVNVILTHDSSFTVPFDNVKIAHSVEEVVSLATELGQDLSVMGGVKVYESFMPLATDLYVTEIAAELTGDTQMAPIDQTQFVCAEIMATQTVDERHDYGFEIVHYRRSL